MNSYIPNCKDCKERDGKESPNRKERDGKDSPLRPMNLASMGKYY